MFGQKPLTTRKVSSSALIQTAGFSEAAHEGVRTLHPWLTLFVVENIESQSWAHDELFDPADG